MSQTPNITLQPTVKKLRFLPSAELARWANVMRTLAILFLSAVISTSHATEQFVDKIILDGEESALLTSPFEMLLYRQDWFVVWKKTVGPVPPCTANHRGYVATWEIRGTRLLLREMDFGACAKVPRLVPLSTFFLDHDSPVDAVWYSGPLYVGKGKRVPVRIPLPDNAYVTKYRYEGYLKLEVKYGYVSSIAPYDPDMSIK